MRTVLPLLALSALVLGTAAEPESNTTQNSSDTSDGPRGGRALFGFGRRRSPSLFRRRVLKPSEVGRWYIRPLPSDGPKTSLPSSAVILTRVSGAEAGPLLLPLAHGSAQLGISHSPPEPAAGHGNEYDRADERQDDIAEPAPLAENAYDRQDEGPSPTPAPLAENQRDWPEANDAVEPLVAKRKGWWSWWSDGGAEPAPLAVNRRGWWASDRSAAPAPLAVNRRGWWAGGGAEPAPLAVNRVNRRVGRRPTRGSWGVPVTNPHRRQADTWVYPSADPPLAPPGHWEDAFSRASDASDASDANEDASDHGAIFEPFAERRSDLNSDYRPPGGRIYRTSKRQRNSYIARRQPVGPKSSTPAAFFRHRRPPAFSSGGTHTSVNVGASVQYPGKVFSSDVRGGGDDVIYDAAVDPQQSASRMTPGVGFRLPPNSVEYGGWRPVEA